MLFTVGLRHLKLQMVEKRGRKQWIKRIRRTRLLQTYILYKSKQYSYCNQLLTDKISACEMAFSTMKKMRHCSIVVFRDPKSTLLIVKRWLPIGGLGNARCGPAAHRAWWLASRVVRARRPVRAPRHAASSGHRSSNAAAAASSARRSTRVGAGRASELSSAGSASMFAKLASPANRT